MGNRTPIVKPETEALVGERLRALRQAPVEGISRRTLYYKLEGYQKQGFAVE